MHSGEGGEKKEKLPTTHYPCQSDPIPYSLAASSNCGWPRALMRPVLLLLVLAFLRPLRSSRRRSDYKRECGVRWQRSYLSRTADRSSDHDLAAQRLLIALPKYQRDPAESIMVYISSFLWALLTDRQLLVIPPEMLYDCDASSLFEVFSSPNFIWHASPASLGLQKISLHNLTSLPLRMIDIYGRRIANLLSKEGSQAVEMQSNLNFDTIGDHPRRSDTLLTSLNESLIIKLFNSPRHREAMTFKGLRPETTFACVFHFLFRFKRSLCSGPCSEAENRLLEAGREGKVRLGVQLSFECSAAPQYEFCLQSLLSEYSNEGRPVVILFITESLHIQRIFKEKYGDQLILPTGDPSPPKDFIPQELYNKEKKSAEECTRIKALDTHRTLQTARNIHLLSLTDVQIVSTNGALGIVSALSQLRSNRTMFGVSLDHNERKSCSLNASDDLQFFAERWKMGV